MLSFHSQGLFIAGIVLIGLSAGIGNGVVFKMVPYISKGNTGAVTGFVGAMGGLGGIFCAGDPVESHYGRGDEGPAQGNTSY